MEEVIQLDFRKCYTLLRKLTNEIVGNDIKSFGIDKKNFGNVKLPL